MLLRTAVVWSWLIILTACGSDSGKINKEALMEPKSDEMKLEAPEQFSVTFETSAGSFEITINRDWAPNGADRFYNLVKNGYYNEQRFFRVVPGFVVQWGMSGDPELTKELMGARILDDPVRESNTRGRITFAATNEPNSRTSQVFINLGENGNLDGMRFAPFGEVTKGMEVVDQINAEYGQQPSQEEIGKQGNAYLEENFPNLDYIKTLTIDE